jgi:RNA polymerase sigma-70 factor, ECF subfamily
MRTTSIGARVADVAGLRIFIEHEYPRIVAGLVAAFGDRAAAEDAVAEAVARMWEQSRRGRSVDVPAAWVRVVAWNLMRTRVRRGRAERRALHRHGPPTIEIDRDDATRIAVRSALATLPDRQRDMVVLHYFLGLSIQEVAGALGAPEGTVKATMHRARARLAAELDIHERHDQEVRP